jgi:ADP-ribose pyrophosphatase YjhB (NUDIX family)
VDNQPPRHSVSISGVITDDHGRALLIQRRDNHHWEPPGGVLELGETITDGVSREIREETGLDIEPGALTGIYKNMTRGIIALVFRCKITGGQLTTNNEVAASAGPTKPPSASSPPRPMPSGSSTRSARTLLPPSASTTEPTSSTDTIGQTAPAATRDAPAMHLRCVAEFSRI